MKVKGSPSGLANHGSVRGLEPTLRGDFAGSDLEHELELPVLP